MRDRIFAALLAVAGGFIGSGVAQWSIGAALVVGGVLLAAWSFLVFVFGDAWAPKPKPAGDTE